MKKPLSGLAFVMLLLGLLLHPKPAHAIIFLPAFLLIPIAQLVAFLLGSFTLPVVITSFIWSKLFKKSWKRALIYSLGFLIVLGLVIGLVLKIINPDRPLF